MSDGRGRRAVALALSVAMHVLLLGLLSGGQGVGLPGVGFAWHSRRVEASEPLVVFLTTQGAIAEPAAPPGAKPSPQASIGQAAAGLPRSSGDAPPATPVESISGAILREAPPAAKPEATRDVRAPAGRLRTAAPPADRPADGVAAPIRRPAADDVASPEPAAPPEPAASAAPAAAPAPTSVAPPAQVAPASEDPIPALRAANEVERQAARATAERLEAQRQEAARLESESRETAALESARVESARVEAARVEAARIEAARADAARIERERRESARLLAERQEAQRHELALQEAARLESERREAARVESERREAERIEAERREAQRREAVRLEAERRELARLEAERREAARLEAERREAARLEAERREAARAEAERIEAERREAARLEAERREAARAEAERIDAQRREAARLEAERREAARLEAERREAARLDAERREAARLEAERREAARREAERQEAESREARLRAIGRQLDEEAARRNEAARTDRPGPRLPFSLSTARRVRVWGRVDPNAELIRYVEAWERKIQFNTPVETVRDLASRPHTRPTVTVAVRSNGSVESVTFVLSSGVPEVDEAIRKIVQSHEYYQAFPPALAREVDVIEIRRTWHFDTAVRLY